MIRQDVQQEHDDFAYTFQSLGYSEIESSLEANILMFQLERKRMTDSDGQ
jgi:hypothetical protein